jgi:hypothetical protein
VETLPIPAGRAQIEDEGAALRISIPPRRNLFIMLFYTAWLRRRGARVPRLLVSRMDAWWFVLRHYRAVDGRRPRSYRTSDGCTCASPRDPWGRQVSGVRANEREGPATGTGESEFVRFQPCWFRSLDGRVGLERRSDSVRLRCEDNPTGRLTRRSRSKVVNRTAPATGTAPPLNWCCLTGACSWRAPRQRSVCAPRSSR